MEKTMMAIMSLKMAGYLAFQGNILLEAKPDKNGSGRKVFLFANTEKLRNDMSNYQEFLQKVS